MLLLPLVWCFFFFSLPCHAQSSLNLLERLPCRFCVLPLQLGHSLRKLMMISISILVVGIIKADVGGITGGQHQLLQQAATVLSTVDMHSSPVFTQGEVTCEVCSRSIDLVGYQASRTTTTRLLCSDKKLAAGACCNGCLLAAGAAFYSSYLCRPMLQHDQDVSKQWCPACRQHAKGTVKLVLKGRHGTSDILKTIKKLLSSMLSKKDTVQFDTIDSKSVSYEGAAVSTKQQQAASPDCANNLLFCRWWVNTRCCQHGVRLVHTRLAKVTVPCLGLV